MRERQTSTEPVRDLAVTMDAVTSVLKFQIPSTERKFSLIHQAAPRPEGKSIMRG